MTAYVSRDVTCDSVTPARLAANSAIPNQCQSLSVSLIHRTVRRNWQSFSSRSENKTGRRTVQLIPWSGSDGVSTPRHEPLRHDGQDDGGGDQLDPDHGGPGHHHEPRGAEVLQDSVQRRNQGKQGSEWESFAERWTPYIESVKVMGLLWHIWIECQQDIWCTVCTKRPCWSLPLGFSCPLRPGSVPHSQARLVYVRRVAAACVDQPWSVICITTSPKPAFDRDLGPSKPPGPLGSGILRQDSKSERKAWQS